MLKKILLLVVSLVMVLNSVNAVLTDSNIAYWSFDNASINGTDIIPLTGSYIAEKSATSPPAQIGDGIIDDAVYFDNTLNQYINLGGVLIPSVADWTYSSWVRIKDCNAITNVIFLSQYDVGASGRFLCRYVTGGSDVLSCSWNGGSNIGSVPISCDNNWRHIVAQVKDGRFQGFENGVLVWNVTRSGSIYTGRNTEISSSQNWNSFGDFDEVGVWSRGLTFSEVTELYDSGVGNQYPYTGIPNLLLSPITPVHATNYTYDVESVTLNLSTNLNASCVYNYNGVNTSMSTTNNLTHTSFFNMGVANTSTKQFDLTYYCEDEFNQTESAMVTFYQQQIPLDFEIYVPVDLQEFNRDVNQIEYHIITNYLATCSQLTYNMTSYEEMSFTGTSEHKHNYSAFYPNIDVYPVSFSCQGLLVNDTIQKNVTFFLTDLPIIGGFTSITDVTSQLPQAGSDMNSFMDSLFKPVLFAVLGFAIIGTIALLFTTISGVIVRALK